MQDVKRKRIIGIFSVASVVIFYAVATVLLSDLIVPLAKDPEKFRLIMNQNYFLSRGLFILMNVVQVIVATIPGEPLEILAGYAFGAVEGTILCIISAAIGTVIIYWLVKLIGFRIVRFFFDDEKINSVKFLHRSKKLNLLVFLIYLIPGTPKDLLTYFTSFTKINFWYFVGVSSIARLPSIVTSTIGGNALGIQNYTFAAIAFAIALIIAGIGILIYKKLQKDESISK